MSASTKEIADLKSRVHNLELALHAMWSLLRDLQPPATQQDVDAMMAKHFAGSTNLGGFSRADFHA